MRAELVVQCNKADGPRVSVIAPHKTSATCSMSIAPNSCRAMRKPLRRRHNSHCAHTPSTFSESRFATVSPVGAGEAARHGLFENRIGEDMLTMKQLRKFVKERNSSGFHSNLQFSIDAGSCGFEVEDLGDVEKFTIDGFGGYRWCPRVKDRGTGWTTAMLIEFGGRLYLNGDSDSDTVSMMTLMPKAKWAEAA